MVKRDRTIFGGRADKKKKLKRNEPELARKLGRAGIVARQPLTWAAVTALMAGLGGPKGRRAARRAGACYVVGAAVGNLPKPLFGRPQPRQRRAKKPQVARGSFPSGHNAAEVAYVFGAAQEAPAAFVPLAALALVGHWSLVRAGKHFVSDTLVGGTMGLAVAAVAAKVWPPSTPSVPRFLIGGTSSMSTCLVRSRSKTNRVRQPEGPTGNPDESHNVQPMPDVP